MYYASPWLHINVFPVNADSILNDIGMLFLSGTARHLLTTLTSSTHFSTKRSVKVEAELLNVAGELIINSRAYEEEGTGAGSVSAAMTECPTSVSRASL